MNGRARVAFCGRFVVGLAAEVEVVEEKRGRGKGIEEGVGVGLWTADRSEARRRGMKVDMVVLCRLGKLFRSSWRSRLVAFCCCRSELR